MAVRCEACGNSYHGNYKVCPKCQAVNSHREVVQGENVPVTAQPRSPLGVAGAPPQAHDGSEAGDGATADGTDGRSDRDSVAGTEGRHRRGSRLTADEDSEESGA